MRLTSLFALAALTTGLFAGACGSSDRQGYYAEDPNGPIAWKPGAWAVVWSDDFDGAAGDPPDPTRWVHDVGGDGWGNRELQYYTDSTNNAALDGAGHLVITARAQPMMGNDYTSARLTTKGLFAKAYGRFEARMKLPVGQGLWPAFWMMGEDFDQVGWPTAGEIDVMEESGHDPDTVYGTLHGPAYGKVDVPSGHAVSVPGGGDADFHVYAVEWDPNDVVLLVDGKPYFQITPGRRPSYARWVWNHPFFILMNLAVGGLFPGPPDTTTVLPQSLVVDYVRVSERTDGGVTVPNDASEDGGAVDGDDADATFDADARADAPAP